MSPLDRKKRAARELAKTEGINYTTALRLVQMAHDAGRALAADPQAEPSHHPGNQYGTFPFSEYKSRILSGREDGVPNLGLAAGVLADGSIARTSFLAGPPHLVITGGPGSGKSAFLYSAFNQLAHNNGPAEVRLWIVSPDGVTAPLRDVDVVERVTPSLAASGHRTTHFLASAADLLEDAVEEMERRTRLFTSHTDRPADLARARSIAVREAGSDGSPPASHPLHLPYIVLMLDECYWLFDPDCWGAELLERQRIRAAVQALSLKGRSAGVHLIFSTQRSTPPSFPAAVRDQSRVIGFRVSSREESVAAIGEPGLERTLPPGVGKISVDGQCFVDFRSFAVPSRLYAPGTAQEMEDAARELPKGRQPEDTGAAQQAEHSEAIHSGAIDDLIAAARRAAPDIERAKTTEALQDTLQLFKPGSLKLLRDALDGDSEYRTQLIGKSILVGSSEPDALALLNSLN